MPIQSILHKDALHQSGTTERVDLGSDRDLKEPLLKQECQNLAQHAWPAHRGIQASEGRSTAHLADSNESRQQCLQVLC